MERVQAIGNEKAKIRYLPFCLNYKHKRDLSKLYHKSKQLLVVMFLFLLKSFFSAFTRRKNLKS
jgi:hypothetical protein